MSAHSRPRNEHTSPTTGRKRNSGLRTLPSVDELVRDPFVQEFGVVAHAAVVRAARAAIAEARELLRTGGDLPTTQSLAARVRTLLEKQHMPGLRQVINATGVIVNTNLGRAPLSTMALAAIEQAARGYSNLEYDLDAGERGSRQAHIAPLICELTGAEDALAVNNNAAGVLVVLASLAVDREVIVSRGELVEIGGGFRVPDVMRQSGARLVEVGTTNRTRVKDYAAALGPETALLLAVHPSNFRIIGFTEAPKLDELAALAHAHDLPLAFDLGGGCLEQTERWGLAYEPTPRESIAAGADIVCFSGDKLLGGPQAGIIAGRAALLDRIARHPLMRAVRMDKLTLAALEATLRAYRDGVAVREIPVWQAITLPVEEIWRRAERWVAVLQGTGVEAEVVPGESTVGGGSLPGETLPTALCAIGARGSVKVEARRDRTGLRPPLDVGEVAARLRRARPPIVGRVHRGRLLLDPRTVRLEEDELLLLTLLQAVGVD